MNNENFPNTPPLGFWVATTFVIIVTVVVVFFAGATPSRGSAFVQYLVLTLELGIVSGFVVGLLQVSRMPYLSSLAKARWVRITVLGAAIGWGIAFEVVALLEHFLGQWLQALPIISGQLVPAAFYGFLIGASIGAVIGFVTGTFQAQFHNLSGSEWIGGNIMCWSIGVAVPLAVFFAGISQIRLF